MEWVVERVDEAYRRPLPTVLGTRGRPGQRRATSGSAGILPAMKRAKKMRAPAQARNPVARALVTRRGGAHQKSNRAQRKAQNDALRSAKLDEH